MTSLGRVNLALYPDAIFVLNLITELLSKPSDQLLFSLKVNQRSKSILEEFPESSLEEFLKVKVLLDG